MSPKKTATVNLRFDPGLKEALHVAAAREHRSVANFLEVLVREYCKKHRIEIPEQGSLFDGDA